MSEVNSLPSLAIEVQWGIFIPQTIANSLPQDSFGEESENIFLDGDKKIPGVMIEPEALVSILFFSGVLSLRRDKFLVFSF